MIEMITEPQKENNVLVTADFSENPCGILGVLESAKISLLSFPERDKTQSETELSLIQLISSVDPIMRIEITDHGPNDCCLIAKKDQDGCGFKVEKIRVGLKNWNFFISFLEKYELISPNDAVILSI